MADEWIFLFNQFQLQTETRENFSIQSHPPHPPMADEWIPTPANGR
jgi:hypothetical protein